MIKYKVPILKIMILIFFLSTCITTYADSEKVSDTAFLLTYDDKKSLENKCIEIEEKTKWDILLVTTNYNDYKSTREFGENYYDENGKKDSGIVCVIDMSKREIALVTIGKAIYYLTDERIEEILNSSYTSISAGDYKNTFLTMLLGIESSYRKGVPKDQYTYDELTGKIKKRKYISSFEIFIAIMVAIIVASTTIFTIIGKYKLKWGKYKYSYKKNGHLNLLVQNDIFVNKKVSKMKIQIETPRSNTKSSSSSGKSTVHKGSSGKTYGGGSKKF